jgi:hypothetical protein
MNKLKELKEKYTKLGEEIKKLELNPIKHTIEKKVLEWGEESSEELNWEEAKKWCKEQGEGWRLPTILELLQAYYDDIEGFGTGYHWSSTEYPKTGARCVSFSDGSVSSLYKTYSHSVRCVRGC